MREEDYTGSEITLQKMDIEEESPMRFGYMTSVFKAEMRFSFLLKYITVPIWSILSMCSLSAQQSELVLATGTEGGTYYAVGLGMKRAIERQMPNVSVRVLPTLGSVENLELLQRGDVDLSIAQHDIVSDYYRFRRQFPDFSDEVAGIASLFVEHVHIIVRRSLRVQSVEQLAGRKVSIGPEGSGTYYNSTSILKTAEIFDDVATVSFSFERTIQALEESEVDAAVITAGAPAPMITDILETGQFELIPLRAGILKRVRREYPDFLSVSIPANTYPHQFSETATLGIAALFICRRDLPKSVVKDIAASLFTYTTEIDHPLGRHIRLQTAKLKMSLPLHSGAEEYFKTLSPFATLKGIAQYLPFVALLFLFAALFLTTRTQTSHGVPWVRLYRTILLLGCFWIIGTFFMHHFERQVNENFLTLWDSFWSIATYLFSGFEDKFPVTPLGKAVSVLLMVGGIGLIAFFTAEFASVLTHKRIEGRPRMDKVEGHILICNWSARGEKIVKEIHDPVACPDLPLVVLTQERIDRQLYESRAEFHLVQFVSGDLLNKSFLRFVGAQRARSIIILADEKVEDPDAQSALIALAIDSLCREQHRGSEGKPHVVAQVLNHRKTEHLKDAGVDETVCSEDYGIGILAQSAMYEKLSEVYDQLLTYSEETNEIYALGSKDIPDRIWNEVFEGKTFLEVAHFFSEEHRDPRNPAILIGVRRGKNVILNPRKEKDEKYEWLKFDTFQRAKDDHPIFLSYEKPDLKTIKI